MGRPNSVERAESLVPIIESLKSSIPTDAKKVKLNCSFEFATATFDDELVPVVEFEWER